MIRTDRRTTFFRATLALSSCALLLGLLPAASQAAPIRMAVMGDSISAPPSTTNWIAQLSSNFPTAITFQNKAISGATTDSIISTSPIQLNDVVSLASTNQIDDSTTIIGGNNAVAAALTIVSGGGSAPFISNYFNDMKLIIDSVALAGPTVHQVIANMPDITVTTAVQLQVALAGYTPAQLHLLSVAIGQTNAQVNAYALSHNVPVIDFYTASQTILVLPTFTLAGHTYTTPFAADDFHPAVWVQGLLANMVDKAYNLKWNQSLPLLSDQQIVTDTGFTPAAGPATFFDVTPYILLPVPEPSTWALAAIAAAILACRAARRRRA